MDLFPRKFYLDDIFDDFMPTKRENHHMKCDIYEKDGLYTIEMDIPGYDKKDISIENNNDYLTITAEKSEEDNKEEKNYIRRERAYGKYQRSFYVGDLDADSIKASFSDGILKVTIPKKEEIENKKIIEIED